MADGRQTAASETRPNWRPLRPGEKVYVLNDMVSKPEEAPERSPAASRETKTGAGAMPRESALQSPEHVEAVVRETAEKLVRELAPAIIERVIREEIEKLKMEDR